MRASRFIVVPLSLAFLASGRAARAQSAGQATAQGAGFVRATLARFDTVTKLDLWPGFAPESVPIAIFDGTTTWLINHPSPPPGFSRSTEVPGAFAMPGRPHSLTANTGTTLGGVPTATVMADFAHGTPRSWAAVIAHEAFHVFQAKYHATWVANEADLFTYPFGSARALALRHLEFDALRRAVRATSMEDAACWAGVAMKERADRFPLIGATSARYERMTELHEGLAQYVQTRAQQQAPIELLPDTGFGTDAIRDRGYRSGLAMGVILDRLEPGWRSSLDRADAGMGLDSLLSTAVRAHAAGHCGFSTAQRADAAARARTDSAMREARLVRQERAALAAPGWTVRIESGDAPLALASFDPLNVTRLSATRVLHSRMLELTHGADSVQVLQHEALTDAAGDHPLFSGIRTLTVPGIDSGLVVRHVANAIELRAAGLMGRFVDARADTTGSVITVHLPNRD